MANNNRFSITNETWSVTADKAGYTQGTVSYAPSVPPTSRESYTALQDAITNDSSEGTLDLTGRAFAPTADEIAGAVTNVDVSAMNFTGSPLTITGGTFFGGVSLTWESPDGDGIRKADLSANYNEVAGAPFDPVAKLHDENASEIPFMAVYPVPEETSKYAPATYAPSTWLDVDAGGVVHTVGGDDNFGSQVTGFTLTDPTLIADFETNIINDGIDNLTIMVRASANIMHYAKVNSWDTNTKTMMFDLPNSYYPNYLEVAFTGKTKWMTDPGHYVISIEDPITSNPTIYYKPHTDSTDNGNSAIVGSMHAMFSNRYGSTNTINFTDSKFYASGELSIVTEGSTNQDTVLTNCVFQTGGYGFSGVNTRFTMDGCIGDNKRARFGSGAEGSTIRKCRFTRTEKSSAILIQADLTKGLGDPWLHTTFEDNYVSLMEANHGQGISLYQGAWQNATIRHNLFVNCQRAHSYQAFGPSFESGNFDVNYRPGATYRFENNLVIHTANADSLGIGGQPSVSFNSAQYPEGQNDETWPTKMYIRNNVILSTMADGLVSQFKDYTLDILGARFTERYVTDNIAGRFNSSAEDLYGYEKPTYSGGNLWTQGGHLQSTNDQNGGTDALVGSTAGFSGDQDTYYDFDSLSPIGVAATHATDNGKVGIRWDNGITKAIALDPPANWYDLYPALPLPGDPTEASPGVSGYWATDYADLVPGASDGGAIASTFVDGGGSYTQAEDQEAIAWWTEIPYQVVGDAYGDFVEVGVVADHFNGIQKVQFVANGVSKDVTVPVYKENDRIKQYRTRIDMSGFSAGDTVEIKAVIFPRHGYTRVLQGDIPSNAGTDSSAKACNFGMKVTKISAIVEHDVPSTGSVWDFLGNQTADWSVAGTTDTVQRVFNFNQTASYDFGQGGGRWDAFPPYIPVIFRGSEANRGTVITNSGTTPVTNNVLNRGAYRLENLTIDAASVPLRPRSSSEVVLVSAKDCTFTGFEAFVTDNYVYDDGTNTATIVTNNPANTKTASKLINSKCDREGRPAIGAFTSSADIGSRGFFMDSCTISTSVGSGVNWMKNCLSINNPDDTTNGGCILNLDVQSAGFGYNKLYKLETGTLVWQPNTIYPNNSKILVEISSGNWQTRVNWTGSDIAGEPTFTDTGWTDDSPHADGWQGRPNDDLTDLQPNMWFEGLTTDNDCPLQPWFYRADDVLQGCVWKRFRITNTDKFVANQRSQIFCHMHHWLMDDCQWFGTSGELLISWSDGNQGWGELANGQSIACTDVKWTNSTVKDLGVSSWPSAPTDMTGFVNYVNGQSGWDITIDASTLAASNIE